jgi:SHS2 domain-containing protein
VTVYRWLEHTGEMELEIEADSEREVFVDAMEAVRELLCDGDDRETHGGDRGEADDAGAPLVERAISLAAEDRPRLLALWLGELAFVAETEGLVPEELGELRLGDGVLDASVRARRSDPPHLIKAVTYHRLAFEPRGGRWRARAVLDV